MAVSASRFAAHYVGWYLIRSVSLLHIWTSSPGLVPCHLRPGSFHFSVFAITQLEYAQFWGQADI